MPTYTRRSWWTVDDAARLLRVNRKTLYAAIAAGDFPHRRIGAYIKIPCEALRLTYVPTPAEIRMRAEFSAVTGSGFDPDQLTLPLDPSCLIPVKRYRDGSPKRPWAYEDALYGHNK